MRLARSRLVLVFIHCGIGLLDGDFSAVHYWWCARIVVGARCSGSEPRDGSVWVAWDGSGGRSGRAAPEVNHRGSLVVVYASASSAGRESEACAASGADDGRDRALSCEL